MLVLIWCRRQLIIQTAPSVRSSGLSIRNIIVLLLLGFVKSQNVHALFTFLVRLYSTQSLLVVLEYCNTHLAGTFPLFVPRTYTSTKEESQTRVHLHSGSAILIIRNVLDVNVNVFLMPQSTVTIIRE